MSAAASTELSIRERTDQVIARIENPAFLAQVEESLPEGVSMTRFKRIAITAIRTNDKLVKADQNSLFASLVKCAQDGLVPDGREAALVIYSNKVSYLPMIGGYRKIAGENGWALTTQVVREGDEFEFEEGLEPKLVHRRAAPGERGDLVSAYAIAIHRDGRKLFAVLDAEEVAKCREVSRAKDDGPWVSWTERMWEKTAGKRLFKQLPVSDRDRVDRVLNADTIEDPAAALYGVGDKTVPARPGDGETPRGGSAALTPDAVAAPSDFDDEPGAAAPAEVEGFDEDEVAAAAGYVIGDGANRGLTIEQVAGKGEPGLEWLLWALRKQPELAFRPQVELYVRARKDTVWGDYQRWLEGQS
jgi:recombination protein RecT